jgi:hypothetical protein
MMRVLVWIVLSAAVLGGAGHQGFDHGYATYGELLRAHVRAATVDYAGLKRDRARLDAAVAELGSAASRAEPSWTREQRLAFWINAYNLLTLRAVVDHYPIRSRLFTLAPRNSIRQIDGVWTQLTWSVAGKTVTLDDIEHRIIRPEFREARIHFAVNCASVSCPPLADEPYVAERLEEQLDHGTRRFFASAEGVTLANGTLQVSSLLKWYGEDFVPQYAHLVDRQRPTRERAILGLLSAYAPSTVAAIARAGTPAIRFLDYKWSLNDCAAC